MTMRAHSSAYIMRDRLCHLIPSKNKTLVPWTIEALNPPNVTFREFLCSKFDLHGRTPRELDKTFVGRSKEKLDLVGADLVAADVVQTFGPYVKYLVKEVNSIMTDGPESMLL